MVLDPWRVATTIMIAGGFLLLIWTIASTLEIDETELDATDPYGNEVAQFRRELHDWDRENGNG